MGIAEFLKRVLPEDFERRAADPAEANQCRMQDWKFSGHLPKKVLLDAGK
ncbi:hypothetical protein L3V16_21305 [Brucella ciceri]|nr:hypothetical protein [Brucella ciceri]MCH6206365.1 hypothetical protein [Brucella ciceri]